MAVDICEILREPRMTKICAPMVRYSKLPFRALVRRYECDICFTPMIMADSFVRSIKARDNDFTTNKGDEPLIVQFAANNPDDFRNAAELVSPYCNGVDLNCGCPQRWAMKEGYGADLLTKPQLVKDIVTRVKNSITGPFTVSVKIRLLKDIRKTIEMCRALEKAGLSFLTVHARTPQMRREPIDLEGLRNTRESVQIPVIANGDVKSLRDAEELYVKSRCDGIMSANGILTNPGLFAGHASTPLSCVQDWLDITSNLPVSFLSMHHHLVFMLEKILPKCEKQIFNNLQSSQSVLAYLNDYYGIRPSGLSREASFEPVICHWDSSLIKRCERIVDSENGDAENDFLGNLFWEI